MCLSHPRSPQMPTQIDGRKADTKTDTKRYSLVNLGKVVIGLISSEKRAYWACQPCD
jgi:hypothetical protein